MWLLVCANPSATQALTETLSAASLFSSKVSFADSQGNYFTLLLEPGSPGQLEEKHMKRTSKQINTHSSAEHALVPTSWSSWSVAAAQEGAR